MNIPTPAEQLPQDTFHTLSSFDPAERGAVLADVVKRLAAGTLVRPAPGDIANVHAHTFFSYSSRNLSPSALVWEAVRNGLSVIGSTDFDVLDAMDEMYAAGDALDIRATVSLETRAFAGDFADSEINSPGEPGVIYVMGTGFVRRPSPDSDAGKLFASLAVRSRDRNRDMLAKVNAILAPAALDYEKDVLPLTPSGNATERHICAAYDARARAVFPDAKALCDFWSDKLGQPAEKVDALLADAGSLHNAIRAKFMKKGGVGYVQPDRESFPRVEDFFRMVKSAGAVPCLAWLDGLSAGEKDPDALLDAAVAWGAGAVNIIPDRNWNIADPEVKKKKLAAMAAFVAAARKRGLPILAGTEMNSPGQKFVDTFDAPELAEYVEDFQDAAYWLYGHTVLEQIAGLGAQSAWAERHFQDKPALSFYAEAGRRIAPGDRDEYGLSVDRTPEETLARLPK